MIFEGIGASQNSLEQHVVETNIIVNISVTWSRLKEAMEFLVKLKVSSVVIRFKTRLVPLGCIFF